MWQQCCKDVLRLLLRIVSGNIIFRGESVMTEGDVTRHNLQRRFLGQQSVATLLRHCFERLKRYSSIAKLYFA